MNEPTPQFLSPDAKPAFAPGVRLAHDETRGWVLHAEGRAFGIDDLSGEILKRCNGETSIGSIVNDLATTFEAPRERIFADVSALFVSLAEKHLVIVA